MKKSDLHPRLRSTAVPVPGRSGCHAVVPPTPEFFRIESVLLPLARRELQVLAEAVKSAPSYGTLLMHMLNRREAVDSSQIEGTRTQFDGLLLHEMEAGAAGALPDADADQTLNYLRAFTWGAQQVEAHGRGAIDVSFILTLHDRLMRGEFRAVPGRLRAVQNFIGGIQMEHARFIPPPPSEVPRLMTELVGLMRYEPGAESHYAIDILARAPIIHAQFETIHPFVDGNGRVGRLLFPLLFLGDGELPIHLASFLKLRQREYYDGLLEVQMHLRWSKWTELFLECAIASCRHTVHLLRELQNLADQWGERLKGRKFRRHSTVWRLVDLLLGQPVITVNAVAERLRVSFQSANAAIASLVEMDLLRPQGLQRRNRAFQAHEVLNLLLTGMDAVLNDTATLRVMPR